MSALGFRAEWVACAAIARHAVQAHPSKGSITLSRVLVAIVTLMVVVAIMADSDRAFKGYVGGGGICVTFFVILWWGQLVASVAGQNLGMGRLVPGIGRRSVAVLVAGWLGGIVCATLPFAIAGLPILAVMSLVAMALSVIAVGMVRPIVFFLVLGIFAAPAFIDRHLMPLSANTVLAGRILLGLWIAIVTVRALQGRPAVGIVPRAMQLATGQGPATASRTAYTRKLENDCASGNADALMLHCLGPVMRSMSSIRVAAPAALTVALLIAAPSLTSSFRSTPALQFFLMLIPFFLQLALASSMSRSVRSAAAEQALVMLSARRPEASAINALLARALALRYGGAWVVTTLTLLVVSALAGVSAGKLTWMLAACLITLAAGALMLRNYAAPQHSTALVTIMVLGAAVTAIVAVRTGATPAAGAMFVAGWSAGALLLFVVRWKAMLGAPVAFPARRYT